MRGQIFKRFGFLSALAVILAGMFFSSFLPILTEHASAAASAVNFMHRQTFQPAQKPSKPGFQSCSGTFTTVTKSATMLINEVFVNADDYNYLSKSSQQDRDNIKNNGQGFPTRSGTSWNIDDLYKLTQGINSDINVIKFKAADGGASPVNGGYASTDGGICTEMTLVQINNSDYGGWVAQRGGPAPGWEHVIFHINTPGAETSGQLKYFSYYDSDCNGHGQSDDNNLCTADNFIMTGQPKTTTGGGGGTQLGNQTGNWVDAATIKLQGGTDGRDGEVYTKFSWYADNVNGEENWSLYYLTEAKGDRAKITWASGNGCTNPISNGTTNSPCTAVNGSDRNCVPFIAVHQGINLSTKDNKPNIPQLQGRINALGGAGAWLYDYNTDANCTYKGNAAMTINAIMNSRIWFYYSATSNQVVTVFADGAGNEKKYVGVYNNFGTNAFRGGGTECQGQAFPVITPNPGAYATYSTTWKFTDGNCSAGNNPYGTIDNIYTVGGTNAEARFSVLAGTAQQNAQPSKNTDDEEKPVCEASSSAMSWLLCPIYNGLSEMSDWILQNILVPFLRTSPVGLDPNDKVTGSTFKIWSAFRVYGDIILVILLIIAVMGQAFGGGVFEAYAARKMLPRILIAAILINISIYVVAFAIDLSNIIGTGIADLITTPLVQTGTFKFSPNNVQAFGISAIGLVLAGITAFLISAGTLSAIVPFILLFVVLPAFLALLGAFITLIFLQALIMALVISSPVAFALYCLPNTEKYFRIWWDWLLRALLVYPIFMTIVGLSDVFTVLIQQANGISGGDKPFVFTEINQVTAAIVAFFVQFLPLLLVPFAFKLAGGLVGKVNGLLSGYGSKLGEAIKGNPNDPDSLRNVTRKNLQGATNRVRAQRFRSLNTASKRGGVGGWVAGRAARLAASGNILAKEAELNEAAKKRIYGTKDNGDDSILNARTSTVDPDGVRRTLDGKEVSDTEWALSKKYYKTMPELQAIEAYRDTKTLSTDDANNFVRRFGQLAQQEGWSDDEVAGHWISTGFARQDERGEYKHGTWKRDPATGSLGFTRVGAQGSMYDSGKGAGRAGEGKADDFLNEAYYKKGSFKGGQMMSSYFDSMGKLKQGYLDRLSDPTVTGDARTNAKARLKQITEIEAAMESQRINPDTGQYENGLVGASAGTMAAFNAMKQIGVTGVTPGTPAAPGVPGTAATTNYEPELQTIRSEIAAGQTHEKEREDILAPYPVGTLPPTYLPK
ncbi:MAG TPA: hypothetical protein VLH86_01480 [Patescibacteria group bacterium]|nr:hypothetical protein [Patescibacteria group bacterium]